MTPSEPALPPPPTTPPAGAAFAGPTAPVLPPLRPAVPIGVAQRTSPRTVALETLALIGLGVNILLAILIGEPPGWLELWFAPLFVGSRIAGWWFRTYTVTEGELILDEGIFQKRHRVVPFSRIQQVEMRQQIFARILGVSLVQVETAGDARATAVELRFLEQPHAEAIRDHLLAQQRRVRGSSEPAPAAGPGDLWRAGAGTERVPLVRLRPAQLIGAAVSSNAALGMGAVIVTAGAGLAIGRTSSGDDTLLAVVGQAGATTLAALGAWAVLISVLSCLQSWDYELTAIGDDLHVRYGLLDRRQHTIPRHRLQHVVLVDNPVRHHLGLVAVRLHSAATPGRSDSQSGHIEIPLLRAADVAGLLERAMGSARWVPPPLQARPHAARRRAILRRVFVTLAVCAIPAALWWPAGAAALPVALLGVPWGRAAHRRAGWSIDGPVLAFSSGVLAHHVELIPRGRIQSARATASPWQRRLGLGTLRIDVAGGGGWFQPTAGLMDLDERTTAQAAGVVTAPLHSGVSP